MKTQQHILNAASNLLGIALLIITAINVSHLSAKSFGDEIAWFAAACLSLSCLLSYMAIRTEKPTDVIERWADRVFFVGLVALCAAVVVLAVALR